MNAFVYNVQIARGIKWLTAYTVCLTSQNHTWVFMLASQFTRFISSTIYRYLLVFLGVRHPSSASFQFIRPGIGRNFKCISHKIWVSFHMLRLLGKYLQLFQTLSKTFSFTKTMIFNSYNHIFQNSKILVIMQRIGHTGFEYFFLNSIVAPNYPQTFWQRQKSFLSIKQWFLTPKIMF